MDTHRDTEEAMTIFDQLNDEEKSIALEYLRNLI
jgi:hypothetical protein